MKFPVEPPAGPVSVVLDGGGDGKPTAQEIASFADKVKMLEGANVVIWTTTPWTIPGNRAIAFSPDIAYGLYEVTDAPADNWAKPGDKLVLADALAENIRAAARIDAWRRTADVDPHGLIASHPLRRHPDAGGYYSFPVPVLPGDFVTEDTGTGFVHIAPGHGQDDFELGTKYGIQVPFTVDADGSYFADVGIFAGKRVMNDKGAEGDANSAVIAALQEVGALIARGRLRHDYPHSWRSKKPVIFRNTPQWFIAMDEDIDGGDTLRERALKAIGETRWVPPQGENRIRGMVMTKPDWVVSRQRAWGVPITVFRHKETGRVIPGRDFNASGELIDRITRSLPQGGRRCLVRGGRQGALPPRPRRRPCRVGEGRGHSRCLVRIQARPTPSFSRRAPISTGLPRSISKAPTSIAAGSNPRCSRLAARAAARRSRRCSPMASSSMRTGAKCRSPWAMSLRRRT